jgi:hypothetical protein
MSIATAEVGTCPTCGHETLPPEPPLNSVVLDRHGDAWQLRVGADSPDGWSCIVHSSDYRGLEWKLVVEEFGPVTVVYIP